LEDLQVANEALTTQREELQLARLIADNTQHAMDAFAQALPIAVLWTDRAGVIEKGNDAASQLLNIGRHHLQRKPLMLFITDRGVLFGAMRSLGEGRGVAAVDVDITVRPRERRPRRMKLCGRRLDHERHHSQRPLFAIEIKKSNVPDAHRGSDVPRVAAFCRPHPKNF
jgi:PAS domain-containing protein